MPWGCTGISGDATMTPAAAAQRWHVRQQQQHQCSHGMTGSNGMATQGVAAHRSKTHSS